MPTPKTKEPLSEQNYINQINGYSYRIWKPLLDLIPIIEQTQTFGTEAGGEINADGTITMSYFVKEPVVSKFFDLVYSIPLIINFDWGTWYNKRKSLEKNDFDFDTIDIPTKCQLLTVIVRSDRFCEGALVDAFESGIILKILKSIKKQLKLKNTKV